MNYDIGDLEDAFVVTIPPNTTLGTLGNAVRVHYVYTLLDWGSFGEISVVNKVVDTQSSYPDWLISERQVRDCRII